MLLFPQRVSKRSSWFELVRDEQGAGVRVIFDIRDSLSEARVLFEPDVSFRWWTLSGVRR